MKVCTKCRKKLHANKFHAATKSADGLQNVCKKCNLARINADNAAKRESGLLTHSQRTRRRLRIEVLQAYGGNKPACACCDEDKLEFLSIDHVAGGGRKHLVHIGQSGLYTWLKRNGFPPGFRILCHNCNQAIGAYGYCPHQEQRDYVTSIPRERDVASSDTSQKIIAGIAVCRNAGKLLTKENVAAAAGVPMSTLGRYRRGLFLAGEWPYVRNYPNGQPIRAKF